MKFFKHLCWSIKRFLADDIGVLDFVPTAEYLEWQRSLEVKKDKKRLRRIIHFRLRNSVLEYHDDDTVSANIGYIDNEVLTGYMTKNEVLSEFIKMGFMINYSGTSLVFTWKR